MCGVGTGDWWETQASFNGDGERAAKTEAWEITRRKGAAWPESPDKSVSQAQKGDVWQKVSKWAICDC